MTNPNDNLIEVRKQFERWGLRIRDKNLLEAYIPGYLERYALEEVEDFIDTCGCALAHSDSVNGITVENPALFIEQMGGAPELKMIPVEVLKELDFDYTGPKEMFYFWFDYGRLSTKIRRNELDGSDVLSAGNSSLLKKYRLKKTFQPEEAQQFLLDSLGSQLREFRELLNSSGRWTQFCEHIKQLLEAEYAVLTEQEEKLNAK